MDFDRRSALQLVAAGLASPALAHASGGPLSRKNEVEAYARFAEETHPRGLEAARDPEWLGHVRRIVAECDSLSPEAYTVRMAGLASWFADGHTNIDMVGQPPSGFGRSLPIRLRAFHDGIYVTGASAPFEALLGARVNSIAGKPVNEAVASIAAARPANNLSATHAALGAVLTSPGWLCGLGLIENGESPVAFDVSGANGRKERWLLPSTPSPPGPPSSLPETGPVATWRAEENNGNFVRELANRRALYVSFDDLAIPVPDALAFTQSVRSAMGSNDFDRLVLDLRRNAGGNNFGAEALRREIARSRFNRPGGFYILTSGTTFSAAQNLCTRLERETFAIFVGEPTGGSPNHYGDAVAFEGAVTGLRGHVSTSPWFDSYPTDRRPWIMPDLPEPLLFADWTAGTDRALERALSDPTSAPPEEIDRDRILFYERHSQTIEWTPFWR